MIVSPDGAEEDEGEEVLEVSLAGGRRDRTDQVGLDRSLVMFSLVFGEASGDGAVDSLTEGVVDALPKDVVELWVCLLQVLRVWRMWLAWRRAERQRRH